MWPVASEPPGHKALSVSPTCLRLNHHLGKQEAQYLVPIVGWSSWQRKRDWSRQVLLLSV